MKICVIGTGYVGLVTGTVFSDLGNDVICADQDAGKISQLHMGEMPIYEPGLQEMVERNVADGRLHFTTDIIEAVQLSEVIFIAVGTPPRADGYADLSGVESAARTIAQGLNAYKVIVNKSTVPVGTGDLVRDIIKSETRNGAEFDVVSNPEFLREGSAISDTLHPDRVVIGAPTQTVAMKILELYAPLERPMLITDVNSAEMIKYASNAFLATKISFINAVANICEAAGADVVQVMKGMGYDRRIGLDFLQAGLGYGGSCFGKDSSCLVRTAERYGYDFRLLKAAIEVNDQQTPRFVDRLFAALGDSRGKTVGLLGLAFKPNTDDMRDAKSLEVIARLLANGVSVKAYDPIAMENAREIFPHITYCKNAYEAASDVDALILVTEWNEFKFLSLEKIRQSMRGSLFFDGRNMYDPAQMLKVGFDYHCVGRAPSLWNNNNNLSTPESAGEVPVSSAL